MAKNNEELAQGMPERATLSSKQLNQLVPGWLQKIMQENGVEVGTPAFFALLKSEMEKVQRKT